MTIGRNDPCHCGSGKKYKKCCAAKDEAARAVASAAEAASIAVMSGTSSPATGALARPTRVSPRPKAQTAHAPPPPRRRAV